ncbi:MAG TPA: hypothetical protein VHR15_20610 [Ktedonobacterales bacterium]|nr:hypothetical protein [Ktedonobacterales bacterium]
MSRLSRFSAVSAVKRLSRPARVGGLVALLALTLGIGLGVRAHTAHAEVSACYTKQIAHAPIIGHKQLPNGWGTLDLYIWAKYRTSDDSYCGQSWAEAKVVAQPGCPVGNLNVNLYDSAGTLVTSGHLPVNGGGGSLPQTYAANTGNVYLRSGHAWGQFSVSKGTYFTLTIPNQTW